MDSQARWFALRCKPLLFAHNIVGFTCDESIVLVWVHTILFYNICELDRLLKRVLQKRMFNTWLQKWRKSGRLDFFWHDSHMHLDRWSKVRLWLTLYMLGKWNVVGIYWMFLNKHSIQENYQSVITVQFGSRAGPTLCRACSGSKMFAKIIRWRHMQAKSWTPLFGIYMNVIYIGWCHFQVILSRIKRSGSKELVLPRK